MLCPFCGEDSVRTLDTRAEIENRVRRKRRCQSCSERFSTVESLDLESTEVLKRDGGVEPFAKGKIAKSIRKATIKGSEFSPRELDEFVDRIASRLYAERQGGRVQTVHIGETLLQNLSDGTPRTDVTCIRYSIVFHGSLSRRSAFRDAPDFIRWLEETFDTKKPEVGSTPIEVINRTGIREPFSYQKLERSIGVASKGRGSETGVEAMAVRLGRRVMDRLQGQAIVSTQQIAQEVLYLLMRTDHVAYLRYASAVKRYGSTDDFLVEAQFLAEWASSASTRGDETASL